jgi:hypothetical protein
MPRIPKNFLRSKKKAIDNGHKLMRSIKGFYDKNEKSNRRWNRTRQEMEAKHVLQLEIAKNLELNPKQRKALYSTIGKVREIDAMVAEALNGRAINVDDAAKLVSDTRIALEYLDKNKLNKIEMLNPFIKSALDDRFKALMNTGKRQVISPAVAEQMKEIMWEYLNQRMGYNIYSEIEEIRQKISIH